MKFPHFFICTIWMRCFFLKQYSSNEVTFEFVINRGSLSCHVLIWMRLGHQTRSLAVEMVFDEGQNK